MNILSKAPAFAKQHQDVALVTVVAATGSTPRHAGAHMLVSGSGVLCGSVGGGRVEMQVVELAQQIAAGRAAQLLKLNLVQDVAMCCGGSMEFFIEPLAPCLGIIEQVLAEHEQRRSTCMHTDLVYGGKSLHAHDTDPFETTRLAGELREILRPCERVVLFGCGHLARAIGPLASNLDFQIVLCDDNQTGALDGEIAWASKVVTSFELHDIEKKVGPLGGGDFLLILTRDHALDQRIVEATLPRAHELEYLGLIGSLGKVGRFRKRILSKEIVSEQQWELLRAPMGLDIRAETPHEIAVSILAELVSIRHRRRRV